MVQRAGCIHAFGTFEDSRPGGYRSREEDSDRRAIASSPLFEIEEDYDLCAEAVISQSALRITGLSSATRTVLGVFRRCA